jgi:acetylornithine/succinyldiaminopimelate/putrescine aminotransferase/predicted amino acid dehydrogenase
MDAFLPDPENGTLSSPSRTASPHFKPRLHSLLQSLRLDVSYESGSGNILRHRSDQGELIEVLDFVGGYGSLLLGHSHPVLVAEAVKLLAEQRPFHVQGSVRPYAQRLAGELSRRCGGGYGAIFTNSGAEAVEAAMKHSLLETGGKAFIALQGGFHGKTLGALQLTANLKYREGFELPVPLVVRVPPNDLDALEAAFTQTPDLAGFIFEPVLGEGGVRPLVPAYCQRAAALCAKKGVPLIADECQTGVGRTGTFLASEQLGVRPDYVILSKALGGGLAKISALLIEQKRYMDEFDLKHTSTYADDDFSCGIALKTLELLDAAMLARGGQTALDLQLALRELAHCFPDVIAEVRGMGLIIGVEFRRTSSSPSAILRFLSAQDDLLFVAVGYLWHTHRIRVAPTLSDRWTLRLEPSLLTTPDEIRRLLVALKDLCERLRRNDTAGLTSFMAATPPPSSGTFIRSDGQFFAYKEPGFRHPERRLSERRVAWLCHFIDTDDLVSLDRSFAVLSPGGRESYLERSVARAWPIVMGGVGIRSRTGESVWLCPILLPFTSSWAKRQLDAGRAALAATLVEKGVDVARSLGCDLVALGQYTSILTANGTRLSSGGMGITTGNTYALLLSTQALEWAQRKAGRRPADSTLAVIGANGNIGRAAAEILAPSYRETILIGSASPGSRRRLESLKTRIPRSRVSTELSAVGAADAVLVATNATNAPFVPCSFKPRAIVCDVSVPAGVRAEAERLRPDVTVIRGGIAALPHGEDLEIVGFPLPAGQTYGCMAEGLLLGLEGRKDSCFTGSITSGNLAVIAGLARKHGFRLAECQSRCVHGSELQEDCCAIIQ